MCDPFMWKEASLVDFTQNLTCLTGRSWRRRAATLGPTQDDCACRLIARKTHRGGEELSDDCYNPWRSNGIDTLRVSVLPLSGRPLCNCWKKGAAVRENVFWSRLSRLDGKSNVSEKHCRETVPFLCLMCCNRIFFLGKCGSIRCLKIINCLFQVET